MQRVSIQPYLLLLPLAWFSAACSGQRASPPSLQEGDIPIQAEFAQFWADAGGLSTFGPAIEPARRDGAILRQTFLNAELVLDPASGSVFLAPLGWTLGLAEPPVARSPESGTYFETTGHNLYAGFVQAYKDFGGRPTLGAPISEFRRENGRLLQYFENAGLYRQDDAPPSEVRWIPLGWAALNQRGAPSVRDFQPAFRVETRARPFGIFLDRHGGELMFGRALTEPYLAEDGAVEQVYERAVLFSPADQPSVIGLRPLGLGLGPPAPAVEEAGEPDSLYFLETGHNVRWAFAAFLLSRRGEELFGLPLEEARLDNGGLIQRFENGVLEYRFDLPPHLAVQLSPLGLDYLRARESPQATPTPPPPTLTPTAAATAQPIKATITTDLEFDPLPRGTSQRIAIQVIGEDGQPWVGVVPIISVLAPNMEWYFNAPATDPQGQSVVVFDVPGLQPGEIVNYEVAVVSRIGIGYALEQFVGGAALP